MIKVQITDMETGEVTEFMGKAAFTVAINPVIEGVQCDAVSSVLGNTNPREVVQAVASGAGSTIANMVKEPFHWFLLTKEFVDRFIDAASKENEYTTPVVHKCEMREREGK